MRIMVVEDDARTSEYVRRGLIEAGHIVDVVADGRDALSHGIRAAFDVVVVDRMLPGLDGLSLVKGLRASGLTTPIIFLSAINGVDDRVEGLESGGDDYLVKPFAFSELLARITAQQGSRGIYDGDGHADFESTSLGAARLYGERCVVVSEGRYLIPAPAPV